MAGVRTCSPIETYRCGHSSGIEPDFPVAIIPGANIMLLLKTFKKILARLLEKVKDMTEAFRSHIIWIRDV